MSAQAAAHNHCYRANRMNRPGLSQRAKRDTMRKGVIHDFFFRRLSVLGLARKYGLTRQQVEAEIRRHLKRRTSERDPDTYIMRLLREREGDGAFRGKSVLCW